MNYENNFNLLRLLFSIVVVYSHSFPMLGFIEPEIFGRPLGNVAAHGFFVVSGYLISDSFLRSPYFYMFAWNRGLRIFPGLLIALILTRFVYGWCDSFKVNPIQYIANGPVWTLTWEVVCYLAVAALGLMGALTRMATPVLFATVWIVYLSNTGNSSAFYGAVVPLAMMFSAGIFIRSAENSVNLRKCSIPVVCVLLLVVSESVAGKIIDLINAQVTFLWGPKFSGADVVRIAYFAAFPFFVICVGREVKPLIKIKDDISYGVYIYGWPIAQSLVYIAVKEEITLVPAWLFLIGMLITLPIAWLSWRIVEQPAMRLKVRSNLVVLRAG